MTPVIAVLCAVGMVVVVPLGLRLIGGGTDPAARAWARLWPLVGGVGVVSLALPRGGLAAGLALVYAGATLALAFSAALRLAQRRSLAPAEIAVLTALVTPAVAGTSLVAERAGAELFGFELGVLTLTVAHFHFAGFAAALVAGLVCHATRSRWADAAALTVPAGTALVFVGYFTGDAVELAGAVVLTAGMWAVAVLVWRDVRPASSSAVTRALFATSSIVLAGTMLLALGWAVGEVWEGFPHLSVGAMAATHGVANAVGFGVCGLLAWKRLADERSVPADACEAQAA